MCILEKTTTVRSDFVEKLSSTCRQILIKEKGALTLRGDSITVPVIMTIRKNPMPYLPEIKYVCDHLGLIFPMADLYKMSAIFLNSSLACPEALKSMSISRKHYFYVTYIISERLFSYRNHLASTAFKKRIPEWIKNNKTLINKLLRGFKGDNDFIAMQYLNEVNHSIWARSNGPNKKFLNKIPIHVLAEQRTYISKYLITYLGAIRWFRWTPAGQNKMNCLKELTVRVVRAYSNTVALMDAEAVAPDLENYLFNMNLREADKNIRENRLISAVSISSHKVPSAPQQAQWNFRSEINFKADKERLNDELDKRCKVIYDRYTTAIQGDGIQEDDEDVEILEALVPSPCQKQHFLLGFIWEELYGRRGKFEETVSRAMRRMRLNYAKKGIYFYRMQLPFLEVDRYMHYYRETVKHTDLPRWLEVKKYFEFNNIYLPEKSAYLSDRILVDIKAGKYVDVMQMYKNNAITSRSYITATLLQRMIRKLAKKNQITVFDKHQRKANLINDCKQQFKDLITYSHNCNRHEAVALKYLDAYLSSGVYIENSDLKKDGDTLVQERSVALTSKWDMMSTRSLKDSLNAKRKLFEETSGDISRAIAALNDIERYRMSLADFADRFSVIRDFLDTTLHLSTQNTANAESEEFNTRMIYILSNDPVSAIFFNRLISYLIKFNKFFKLTDSYFDRERRIYSKPIRQIEELLILRYRTLWDLRETKKVYLKKERIMRGKDLDPETAAWVNEEMGKYSVTSLKSALRELIDSRDLKDRRTVAESMGLNKPVSESYKFAVAQLFGVTRYLFSPFELISCGTFSNLVSRAPRVERPSVAEVPSDHARPQIMTYAEVSNLIDAITANPMRGSKKRSKAQKKRDRSYDTIVRLFEDDNDLGNKS